MWFVDLFSTYLYGLKFVAIVLACALLISGLDDLLIDCVYWIRRAWRSVTVYRHHFFDARGLHQLAEKPMALMVPAWRETGVVGRMAELAAQTLDYENYHIFVGTYPNDPDTQGDVDLVCARFKNVHKVVCARPGPTSKADCLNNILDAIRQFERQARLQFAGFILHDAEDVISPMELRLFNYLVDRKDLIQLPVYPFARRWYDATSGHYMDEFAEAHGKDILVRETIAGQVPSAGVGTCFSRRAILTLLVDGLGVAFDVNSLTEDYDIGMRLCRKGLAEVFVRFPILGGPRSAATLEGGFGATVANTEVVCVREYFPNTLAAAVRQKSRWIVGIVYQGFKTHRWTGDPLIDYFLWRDRKGCVSNFVSFFAALLSLQLILLWGYERFASNPYHFLSIFEGDTLATLLPINLVLMANRIVQRTFFVSVYYGLHEGLLSIPRLLWGNVINFLANCRAIRQIVRSGDVRRVAWDKTSHDFPSLAAVARAREPIGQILIALGAIDQGQLDAALANRLPGLRLGASLVHQGVISAEQLAAAVSSQWGVRWERVTDLGADWELIAKVPPAIALHYAVVPLREEGDVLVLASEDYLDPVATAALARKLKRPVSYVIAPKGEVTVALRRLYARRGQSDDPRQELSSAVRLERVPKAAADGIWREYVSKQVLFAELLIAYGRLDVAALGAALLRYERSTSPLGEFLVGEGIIHPDVLRQTLRLQQRLQGTMASLIDEWSSRRRALTGAAV